MKKKIRCPYFELNDLERAYHGGGLRAGTTASSLSI